MPAEQIVDPITALVTGLPPEPALRTQGQPAIDVLGFEFMCSDEVYDSCTALQQLVKHRGRQAYVLRETHSFTLTLAGRTVCCTDAVTWLLKRPAPLGGTLSRRRFERVALQCPGPDRHRPPASPPAHPPPAALR